MHIYTLSSIVFVLQWNEWKALREAIRSGQLKVISVLVLYRKHLFTNGLANGMMPPFWLLLFLWGLWHIHLFHFRLLWVCLWNFEIGSGFTAHPGLPQISGPPASASQVLGLGAIYHHAGNGLTFKAFAFLFQSKPLCVITDVGIFNNLHIHEFRLQSKLCLIWFLLFGLLKRWKQPETPFETLFIVSEQTWASLLMGCKPGFTSQLLTQTSPLGGVCQTQESAFLQVSTQITFVPETPALDSKHLPRSLLLSHPVCLKQPSKINQINHLDRFSLPIHYCVWTCWGPIEQFVPTCQIL